MAGQGSAALIRRRRHMIQGTVQGVGFRPFVYRSAHECGLTGWVRNTPSGVELEVQGNDTGLAAFDYALRHSIPPLALITSHTRSEIPLCDETSFTILPSGSGAADISIAPDSALCSDCLRELFDPTDRRYRYPFITCTNCGPRYSIITGSPYDRPMTTMAGFPLCPDCLREYQDPLDRRFHAQPIACHSCGPQISLRSSHREDIAGRDEAVIKAVQLLKDGAVIAVKGIGGYHLAVDAGNHEAVKILRQRKNRDEKPFAVMAADIGTARTLALMNDMEERLLTAPEAPIVIVRKRPVTPLSGLIAPGNGWLGLMLPYAPLHHLLFQGQGARGKEQKSSTGESLDRIPLTLDPAFQALVMTSGNISDEPVAFEDEDALRRLAGIADYFLLHDRPIHIRSDDSVMRVFQGKPLFYRRARGYAPRAVTLPFSVPPLLATGAELKGAVCLADGNRAVPSQHIGDLQNQSTLDSFSHTVAHLTDILAVRPSIMACDLHPDYLSTRFAEQSGLPLVRVQHHHAHMASCMAENGLDGDVIGLILDGTGYGSDDTIWGGEFLVGGYDGFRRAGHFRPVPLPGGDAAVREPWRMALSYLYQSMGEDAFTVDHPIVRILPQSDRALFAMMLRRAINSPLTSSCGRLFDAVAALLNVRHIVSYDGQAAIELEALAEDGDNEQSEYPFNILSHSSLPLKQIDSPLSLRERARVRGEELSAMSQSPPQVPFAPLLSHGEGTCHRLDDGPFQVDFSPMFAAILDDLATGVQSAAIAYRFHLTVAAASTEVCLQIAAASGLERIILSGGVFQNRLLSEMIYTALTDKGLTVFTHRLMPPNDGGIALGQAAIAGRRNS